MKKWYIECNNQYRCFTAALSQDVSEVAIAEFLFKAIGAPHPLAFELKPLKWRMHDTRLRNGGIQFEIEVWNDYGAETWYRLNLLEMDFETEVKLLASPMVLI